jgi:hypothetical protein
MAETADADVGTGTHGGDLEVMIVDDSCANGVKSSKDNSVGLCKVLATGSVEGGCQRRVGGSQLKEDCTSETRRVVEAHHAHGKHQGVQEYGGIQWHASADTAEQGCEEGRGDDGNEQLLHEGGDETEGSGMYGYVAGNEEGGLLKRVDFLGDTVSTGLKVMRQCNRLTCANRRYRCKRLPFVARETSRRKTKDKQQNLE